jgi:ribosomal protein S27AE
VAEGTLIRPDACLLCGNAAVLHGHHDNYAIPLAVRWVCRSCHSYIHLRELEAQR